MVDTEFRNQKAVMSECRSYRYWLERDLSTLDGSGVAVFIMLNPSIANAEYLDPTCVRCGNFAKSWGHARFVVVNLFAWRSTDPAKLRIVPDPVGNPMNDEAIMDACAYSNETSGVIVAAWGRHGKIMGRGDEVLTLLEHQPIHALGLTKFSDPLHPLYLRADLSPQPITELQAGQFAERRGQQ